MEAGVFVVTKWWQGEDVEQSMQLLPDSDSDVSDGGGLDDEDDERETYAAR
jgi:hypothetical protein